MDLPVPIENVERIYLFPLELFEEEGFVERFSKQLAHFRARIRKGESIDTIRGEMNAFFLACMNSTISADVKAEAELLYYGTLNFCAQQYRSEKTFQDILSVFESVDSKEKFFQKFPTKAKLTYADTLFQYYSLIKRKEPLFSFEKTDLLIKAKFYLWKVYIHHLDGKAKLSNVDLSHCLTTLSMCLGELNRWFEPLYYLNEAKCYLPNNPNTEYSRALILETIKDKTCLNFNAVLILAIIDSCRSINKLPIVLPEQKAQLDKTESDCRKFLASHKQSISKIRAHKTKIDASYRKYGTYRKFCIDEQLFLNEHSLFCSCGNATIDDLKVETKHEHTRIEWAKPFEDFLDVLAADFTLARQNYFFSLSHTKTPNAVSKRYRRENSEALSKYSLLKTAFKGFYSLLDQICYAIFRVFGIDPEVELLKRFPDANKRPKLYFLNMWDLPLLEDQLFVDNFYLIALYSISKDLNNSKFAALKDFKVIRNAMEHKLFFVTEGPGDRAIPAEAGCYSREELTEKGKILMLLTKSAILSFTYLVRRQSKIIESRLKVV